MCIPSKTVFLGVGSCGDEVTQNCPPSVFCMRILEVATDKQHSFLIDTVSREYAKLKIESRVVVPRSMYKDYLGNSTTTLHELEGVA